MPLPVSNVERELRHTRRVRFEGYKRADGLWDIEAHLTDVKNHDNPMKAGVRRAGQPIHEMWLRLTIDRSLNDARRRRELRRGALSRRLRNHRARLQAADRLEPGQGFPPEHAKSSSAA